MARSSKLSRLIDKHITKEERETRANIEQKLRGETDKLIAPSYLTDKQKDIFNYVVKQGEELELFGNTDIFLISQYAVCIDSLIEIATIQNTDPKRRYEKKLLSAWRTYSDDYTKYRKQLSLSSQAGRKAIDYAAAKRKADLNPIIQILNNMD